MCVLLGACSVLAAGLLAGPWEVTSYPLGLDWSLMWQVLALSDSFEASLPKSLNIAPSYSLSPMLQPFKI